MSIGRRILNLARGELNDLLDRASQLGDDDQNPPADPDGYGQPEAPARSGRKTAADLSSLSDAELSAEIERRRRAREAQHRGAANPKTANPRGANPKSGEAPPNKKAPSGGNEVARAYAALEIPNGSDFDAVRRAYRAMMRKYHPDRHAQTPEKQRAATDLAQRLTEAYKVLERRLKP